MIHTVPSFLLESVKQVQYSCSKQDLFFSSSIQHVEKVAKRYKRGTTSSCDLGVHMAAPPCRRDLNLWSYTITVLMLGYSTASQFRQHAFYLDTTREIYITFMRLSFSSSLGAACYFSCTIFLGMGGACFIIEVSRCKRRKSEYVVRQKMLLVYGAHTVPVTGSNIQYSTAEDLSLTIQDKSYGWEGRETFDRSYSA